LPENIINNFCPPKGSVLDTFGGTGTTMIAAEKIGRKSYLMELDPKYCDVILKRWEDFTGKKAVLSELEKE
jgi:DNA modification methylase